MAIAVNWHYTIRMEQPPLPNDLMRNPPWRDTVMTWPVNEQFLTLIDNSERMLEQAGYALKYGIEINLDILTAAEAEKLRSRGQDLNRLFWRSSCADQFKRDLAAAAGRTKPFRDAALEICAKLEATAEKRRLSGSLEDETWLDNWSKASDFLEKASVPGESRLSALARKNFMIAALHLLPPEQGGLHGLIEQRFASEHYGHGWWDGRDALELRTIPVTGHRQAIENYHLALWQLQRASAHFGFVPVTAHALAQPHFSLWRLKDGKNVMAEDGEDCLGIKALMARNVYYMLNREPLGDFSRIHSSNPRSGAPFMTSSRAGVIRTCEDNWELRLQPVPGVTHLAQSLFYIAWAAYSTIGEPTHDLASANAVHRSGDSVLDRLYRREDPIPDVHKIRRVRIAADPPRVACPFMSSLEAGILGENGEIIVSGEVLSGNLERLKKSIGPYGFDLFSVMIGDKVRNLETPEGWRELFRKIRVGDGRSLDVSAIPERLRKHFQGLAVGDIRADVYMPAPPGVSRKDAYGYTDLISAHIFARCGIFRAAEKDSDMTAALEEIYAFICGRATVYDPEDAATRLDAFYRFAPDPSYRGIGTGPVPLIVTEMIYGPLSNALRKRMQGPRIADCFEDSGILAAMFSFREGMLKALPESEKEARGDFRLFVQRFGRWLQAPDKLYAFRNVSSILGAIAIESVSRTLLNIDLLARVLSTGRTLQEVVDILENQDPPEDFEFARSSQFGHGCATGKSVALLTAAAQIDTRKTIGILEEYNKSAASLETPFTKARGDLSLQDRSRSLLCISFVQGMAAGIERETQSLLADPSPLREIREKAEKIIRSASRPS